METSPFEKVYSAPPRLYRGRNILSFSVMKLFLLSSITRVLIVCFASAVILTRAAFAESADNVTYTKHQEGPLNISENNVVSFENIQYQGRGAAIYQDSASVKTSLSLNNSVIFSGNTAPVGGAFYNKGSIAILCDNGNATFIENTADDGGAIVNEGEFGLIGNEDISFSKNTANAYGGAIYNRETFTQSTNESVTFIANTADEGGAIYNTFGTYTLSDNGNVIFIENKTTSSRGGAIFNSSSGTFTLSNNRSVTFSGNQSSSSGGALCNYGSFSLNYNGVVSFSGNKISTSSYSSYGVAIYNYSSFSLIGNNTVSFTENSASSYNVSGGAICNEQSSTFALSGNGDVIFSKNSTSQSSGGAIANYSAFTLSDNGNVTFNGNISVRGGAISNSPTLASSATFTLSDNGAVTFIGNKSSSYGGAIYNYGDFALSGNGNLTFSENTVSSYGSNGGAIYNNYGTFTLNGNGNVSFCGNKAIASISYYGSSGGAIYNDGGIISLGGNGDVFFEKNAEISNASYRLRSIYSTGTLNLSSAEDKKILFKDSMFAGGAVNLNQDGAGDIIFSGASIEADLREVKGGVDGTAEEILYSRTSEIATNATLYGGRLIVEDEAILKVNGLSVAEGASVVVKDGTLSLMNGNATITTADDAEKAVMVGASLGASSLVGMDAEHRGSVDGAHIDIAEGAEFSLQHLVLGATTRVTDAPAAVLLDDVTAELVMGVNASLTGSDMLLAGTTLEQSGNTGVTLTLSTDASVLMLEATTFDSVTLTGSSLVLELAGMEVEMFDSAEWIGISFTSGMAYATFDKSLAVTLSVDGATYESGYTMESDDSPTTMYFRGGKKLAATPEPAVAALSMLALAGLAARRRRKG